MKDIKLQMQELAFKLYTKGLITRIKKTYFSKQINSA